MPGSNSLPFRPLFYMPRYFIEVFYKGTSYAGFQVQKNANSIQAEVEKALQVFFRADFALTGSSRTDAGVHALSNYFHFDSDAFSNYDSGSLKRAVYNINAILPLDIVVKRIFLVRDEAHCRFDAVSREYRYHIYTEKDPFLADRAFFFPFKVDFDTLQDVATSLIGYTDFTSFAKRNTQVAHFRCTLTKSIWSREGNTLVYCVQGNRFLRGMVRGLVGTMLKAGTGKISTPDFANIVLAKDCSKADFSVPAHGLFLYKVSFPVI